MTQQDQYGNYYQNQQYNQQMQGGMGPPPQGGQQQPPQQPPPQPNGQQFGGNYDERAHIEEIAEAIIDEKWQELVKNLNKFSEWKEKTDETLSKMQQEIDDVKASFDKLHKAIIGKIGEYDQNILNVGTEVKAMERVFQKILPTFTENVNELSRITKKARTMFENTPSGSQKKNSGQSKQGQPQQEGQQQG